MAKKKYDISKQEKKKKWRENMYKTQMGNKQEGQGFADLQKKNVISQYRKLLRKENKKQHYSVTKTDLHKQTSSKKLAGVFGKAERDWKKRKDEKQEKFKEEEVQQKSKTEADLKYKKKKKDDNRRRYKQTFRGQPKMGTQMKALLKKIEASTSSSS